MITHPHATWRLAIRVEVGRRFLGGARPGQRRQIEGEPLRATRKARVSAAVRLRILGRRASRLPRLGAPELASGQIEAVLHYEEAF